MSNTGHKCIIDMEPYNLFYYKVTVSWRGEKVCKYVSKDDYHPLLAAIELRDTIEQELGKPRTEMHVRASGVFHQQIGRSKRNRVVEWERE